MLADEMKRGAMPRSERRASSASCGSAVSGNRRGTSRARVRSERSSSRARPNISRASASFSRASSSTYRARRWEPCSRHRRLTSPRCRKLRPTATFASRATQRSSPPYAPTSASPRSTTRRASRASPPVSSKTGRSGKEHSSRSRAARNVRPWLGSTPSSHGATRIGTRLRSARAPRSSSSPPVLEDDPRRLRTPLERERAKAERGLAGKRIGIYVGTGTVANVAAMLALPTLSGGVDALLIVGNVARNVIGDALPRPLRITGEVSEDELDALLGLADVALEPTSTGNGISRKVIAYVRAGVPVVTTPAGLRGLPLAPERDVLCGPLDAFPQLIARTFADPAAAQARAARAKGALLAAFTPDAARLRFERMLRDVFQH